jgi:hypothetical protein
MSSGVVSTGLPREATRSQISDRADHVDDPARTLPIELSALALFFLGRDLEVPYLRDHSAVPRAAPASPLVDERRLKRM